MTFISTRGASPAIGFRDAILSGLAPDGGLYVPDEWPGGFLSGDALSDIDMAGPDGFAQTAARILAVMAGTDYDEATLFDLARDAYATFEVSETVPLKSLGPDLYMLELFHGPTLAFKDVAMQLLARLYARALSDLDRETTIIGATSGDTGGAAIHAFAHAPRTRLVMLHPKGRISDVQRRIMTTETAPNIVNVAVNGSFDDCQRIVKTLFADTALQAELPLGGVNSINWIRLAIQMTYYVTATRAAGEPLNFVVPTGNFGDVFAGYGAHRMGLQTGKLAVAVNRNDIMRRALEDGVYRPDAVHATSSPSMDIQVASNFERLIFEASGRDAARTAALMTAFIRDGGIDIPGDILAVIRQAFCAERASEAEVDAAIAETYETADMLIDPHTAVGLVAARKLHAAGRLKGPSAILATASPAKFPQAVQAASGVHPGLPPRYGDLHERAERCLEADADVAAIRTIVLGR